MAACFSFRAPAYLRARLPQIFVKRIRQSERLFHLQSFRDR
jgi:hypothetical protein